MSLLSVTAQLSYACVRCAYSKCVTAGLRPFRSVFAWLYSRSLPEIGGFHLQVRAVQYSLKEVVSLNHHFTIAADTYATRSSSRMQFDMPICSSFDLIRTIGLQFVSPWLVTGNDGRPHCQDTSCWLLNLQMYQLTRNQEHSTAEKSICMQYDRHPMVASNRLIRQWSREYMQLSAIISWRLIYCFTDSRTTYQLRVDCFPTFFWFLKNYNPEWESWCRRESRVIPRRNLCGCCSLSL